MAALGRLSVLVPHKQEEGTGAWSPRAGDAEEVAGAWASRFIGTGAWNATHTRPGGDVAQHLDPMRSAAKEPSRLHARLGWTEGV